MRSFAAQDFMREIDAMAANFTTMRIDGIDYRRRDLEGHAETHTVEEFDAAVERFSGVLSVDGFEAVIQQLAKVHPSKYVKMLDGLDAVALSDVHVLHSQTDALRLVALVDRLYDAQLPVIATGVPLDQVFAEDMLSGGYRKKYLRAISRLIALTSGTDL